jgi:hypothetical protein
MTDQKQSETHKLEDLPGVGKRTAEKLRRAGIVTVLALRAETPSHLSEKTGIPQTAAQKVIQAAENTGIPQTAAQKVIQAWRAKYRAVVRRVFPWVTALTATVALSVFVIGLTWGTTKWEREREQLESTLPSLELRLFDLLRTTDKDAPALYGDILEYERHEREHLDDWKRTIDLRADRFAGKVIGHSNVGGGGFNPTPEYKPIYDEYGQHREAMRKLGEEVGRRKRLVACSRGATVDDGEVVTLWQQRLSVLSRIDSLRETLARYAETPAGRARSALRLAASLIGLLLLLALLAVFIWWNFG